MRCGLACLFTSCVVIGCAALTRNALRMRCAERQRRATLQAQGVRIIDAAGGLSYAGLVQIHTDSGFGSICGMNQAAADVVCKQLGYGSGVASDSPCGSYGGSDVCGAPGSPVAMQSLTCTGAELSVTECEWSAPDAACSSHGGDSVVFCTGGAMEPQVASFMARGDLLSRPCALHTLRWDRCACCPKAARQALTASGGLKYSCRGLGPLYAARASQMAQLRLRANRWASLALSRRGAVA